MDASLDITRPAHIEATMAVFDDVPDERLLAIDRSFAASGTQDTRFVMQRMKVVGVTFSPTSYIRSIDDHAVTLYDTDTYAERTIENVSAAVLSTGRLPIDGLAKDLEGKVAQFFTIGDALAARLFATASCDGHKFARYIGEPDAPKTFSEAFFQKNPAEFSPRPAELA